MTDNVPSDWVLAMDGEVISEPGDGMLEGWTPNTKKAPIEGPDMQRYGHDIQLGNGVDFTIKVKHNSRSWVKLTEAALGTDYHSIVCFIPQDKRAKYPEGTVVELGTPRGQISPGEGRAGVSQTQDVTFAVSGIGRIFTAL